MGRKQQAPWQFRLETPAETKLDAVLRRSTSKSKGTTSGRLGLVFPVQRACSPRHSRLC